MPNAVNEAIKDEYNGILAEDVDVLFVQPVGMDVMDSNAFRVKLAEQNLRMQLLKNSLAKQVLADRGFDQTDYLFDGPAAAILALTDDVDAAAIAASKVVAAWKKETKTELPEVKGGLLDGTLLDGGQATELRKLPSREELLSILVGQILGPGRALAAQLKGPGGLLAGALKARVEQLEDGGSSETAD